MPPAAIRSCCFPSHLPPPPPLSLDCIVILSRSSLARLNVDEALDDSIRWRELYTEAAITPTNEGGEQQRAAEAVEEAPVTPAGLDSSPMPCQAVSTTLPNGVVDPVQPEQSFRAGATQQQSIQSDLPHRPFLGPLSHNPAPPETMTGCALQDSLLNPVPHDPALPQLMVSNAWGEGVASVAPVEDGSAGDGLDDSGRRSQNSIHSSNSSASSKVRRKLAGCAKSFMREIGMTRSHQSSLSGHVLGVGPDNLSSASGDGDGVLPRPRWSSNNSFLRAEGGEGGASSSNSGPPYPPSLGGTVNSRGNISSHLDRRSGSVLSVATSSSSDAAPLAVVLAGSELLPPQGSEGGGGKRNEGLCCKLVQASGSRRKALKTETSGSLGTLENGLGGEAQPPLPLPLPQPQQQQPAAVVGQGSAVLQPAVGGRGFSFRPVAESYEAPVPEWSRAKSAPAALINPAVANANGAASMDILSSLPTTPLSRSNMSFDANMSPSTEGAAAASNVYLPQVRTHAATVGLGASLVPNKCFTSWLDPSVESQSKPGSAVYFKWRQQIQEHQKEHEILQSSQESSYSTLDCQSQGTDTSQAAALEVTAAVAKVVATAAAPVRKAADNNQLSMTMEDQLAAELSDLSVSSGGRRKGRGRSSPVSIPTSLVYSNGSISSVKGNSSETTNVSLESIAQEMDAGGEMVVGNGAQNGPLLQPEDRFAAGSLGEVAPPDSEPFIKPEVMAFCCHGSWPAVNMDSVAAAAALVEAQNGANTASPAVGAPALHFDGRDGPRLAAPTLQGAKAQSLDQGIFQQVANARDAGGVGRSTADQALRWAVAPPGQSNGSSVMPSPMMGLFLSNDSLSSIPILPQRSLSADTSLSMSGPRSSFFDRLGSVSSFSGNSFPRGSATDLAKMLEVDDASGNSTARCAADLTKIFEAYEGAGHLASNGTSPHNGSEGSGLFRSAGCSVQQLTCDNGDGDDSKTGVVAAAAVPPPPLPQFGGGKGPTPRYPWSTLRAMIPNPNGAVPPRVRCASHNLSQSCSDISPAEDQNEGGRRASADNSGALHSTFKECARSPEELTDGQLSSGNAWDADSESFR